MKIIVDAMGGDNAPDEVVRGAVMACEEYGVEIVLTGRGEDILRSLEKMGRTELPRGIEIANATQVVEMDDEASTAARRKKDSSMTIGLHMLHDGEADAMVSAGNTGALLSGATLIVKRIRGIRRAAMAPVVPSSGGGFVLIDCGANAECTPEYMLQFAFMGAYYAQGVLGVAAPRVGLLNIGSERSKGAALHVASYELLEKAGQDGAITFVGNVESKEAMFGKCDVLVCDGFAGNVFLKAVEGASAYLFSELKAIFGRSILTKLAALIMKKHFRGIKAKVDPDKVGGTVLLGISRPVIKAHGSSGAVAICSAIRQAVSVVEMDVVGKLQKNIELMKIDEAE